MNKIIDFEYKGNKYEISSDMTFATEAVKGGFDYFFIDLRDKQFHRIEGGEEVNVTVLKNGEPMTEFGESFGGVTYNAVDFLHSAISAYANDIPDFKAENVSNAIKNVRNAVQNKGKTEDGISLGFLNTRGDMLDLEYATDKNAGYVSLSEELSVLISRDTGDVVTDTPEFYEEAEYRAVLDGENILYKTDSFEKYVEKPALKDKAFMERE